MWHMSKNKIELKYWLIFGAIGFGIPLAIALLITFWQLLTIPRDIFLFLCLCIGGGFCVGGVMYLYFLTSTKIKKRRYMFLHGSIFYGIPSTFLSLIFQYFEHNLDHIRIIFTFIFFMILGSFLGFGLYELDLIIKKRKKIQKVNDEKIQS